MGLLKIHTCTTSLEKKPTPKKIIKLLDANPQNEPERMALDHLKRYIRSLDGQAVSVFFFIFDRE